MHDVVDTIIKGDCIQVMEGFPQEFVNIVIADPPYWNVAKESWDRSWRTVDDYIDWNIAWSKQVHRVLKKGGSFYLFGYFRHVALLLRPLMDIGFELRQQIIIDKGMRSVAGRATKNYKIFPNVTESILFLYKDSKPFIKQFLKQRQKELKITAKEINELLGVKSNGGGMWSIYTGNNVCEQTPTRDLWGKLQDVLHFDLAYEEIAMTFNPQVGYTDVWTDINFYEEDRIHPTQKPIKLLNRIIIASSNEGNLVLDPFSGSGSTCVSAKLQNRHFIGIELDEKYHRDSLTRLASIIMDENDLYSPIVRSEEDVQPVEHIWDPGTRYCRNCGMDLADYYIEARPCPGKK